MEKLNKKRRSVFTLLIELVTLLSSSFILSLSFPGFMTKNGIAILSFVALIPVFAVIRNTSWKCVWYYGFLYGMIYYFFFNYWLKGFHPLAILIAPVIKGVEMMLLFLVLKALDVTFPKYSYILKTFAYVTYAYLVEHWFASYPYGNIVYALYPFKVLIQIVDVTGIWGPLFLLVFPQAFLGDKVCDILNDNKLSLKEQIHSHIIPLSIYATLVVISIIYGIVTLNIWKNKEEDRTFRVSTVQHNHDSWKGGYTTYRKNFSNLKRYTEEALSTDPDIVIWSETAFVPSVSWHTKYSAEGTAWEDIHDLTLEFVSFAEKLNTPLLTGNPKSVIKDPSLPPYDESGNKNSEEYNTVILFKDGKIEQEYLKQHLVPFTEHFPYEKQFPWLYKLLLSLDYNWWLEGKESTVFNLDGVHFSTPICFEDVFSSLIADFVKNGADVIVNMTNDNWSKADSAEWQHAKIASFRSIETRKATVRGTNSGVTCLILPTGEIVDPMPTFTMGTHTYDVPVYSHESNKDTFYVRHIDLFAKISLGITILALLLFLSTRVTLIIKKVKEKRK